LDKDAEAMRRVRGARIAMVFQEPMTALNPVFSIGDQIAAAVRAHEGGGRRAAWERAVEMLDRVQVPSPRERARDYPHQLSGGLRQRAMIALALAQAPAAGSRHAAPSPSRAVAGTSPRWTSGGRDTSWPAPWSPCDGAARRGTRTREALHRRRGLATRPPARHPGR